MNIRKKTIIIVCLIVLILTTVYHVLSIYVLGNKFKQIEKNNLNEHISQALRIIQDNITNLDTLNLDWSRWDDSYKFINDGNKEFIVANLTGLESNPIKLNAISFINLDGKVIFKEKVEIGDAEFDQILKEIKEKIIYKNNTKELNIKPCKGIISMENGIMLISCRPIVRTDGRGPVRGIIIMGRHLSNDEIHTLGGVDNYSIYIEKYYEKNPLNNYSIFAGTIVHSDFKSTILDENRIIGSTVIKDVFGDPKLELLIENGRGIYLEGMKTRIIFNSSLIVSGLIFGIILLLILEKIVLIPLQDLSKIFMDIEKKRDLSYRLPVKGDNEFDNLSRVANKMLESLNEYQKKIEQNEHRYRHLFESLIYAFAYLKVEKNEINNEKDYVFLKVNEAYEKLTGLMDKDISGKKVSEIYCSNKEEIFNWIKEISTNSKMGEKTQIEKYINLKDKWFLLSAYSPENGYIIVVYQDITELKNTEYKLIEAKNAADDSVKMKNEILENMSHEIRTPINAIIGINELLKQTNLNQSQKDLIESVESAGNVLLNIVNCLLDFSKIEAGKLNLNNHKFNMYMLIKNLVSIMSVKADKKGIGFSYTISDDIPEIIFGDEERLNQIIINLLSNSIKFTFDGEVSLKVLLETKEEDKVLIRFEIYDTGIGIDNITKEELFESYIQEDSTVTRKYGGTGFELSICKRLAELMGGELGAKSNLYSGSIFWFNAWFNLQ
ncbi:signal transduction histidine-protein kinase BarA [Clostridium homopropionicum DSM 5847]|uniref:Circadian input-output histidine kinase CikA n=1 Tax=Clostridium homopropionicum DSM 5847 TaxID=1121318 RepID=A0A0L6ZCB8_9CLOT|nr:CHASE4 domain-containing protein [Clostridium homopropionicum]KOA20629.1 signal transduction histidine-protein kinase BarA [Clostridium homopropionicum DSM 5847]SFF92772.1 His Kinase A (phospho-acceptor) domain-containing protein [Clostridium homopropionicum]